MQQGSPSQSIVMSRAFAMRSRTLFISAIGVEGIIKISSRPRRIEGLNLDVVCMKKLPCWSDGTSGRGAYNIE
jgi:hypothetical protein